MIGCAHCWSTDGGRVSSGELALVERVVSASHFGVVLRRCAACGQHYAQVHVELVSFSGRDDMGSHAIPLSPDEASRLVATRGESAVEDFLLALSPRPYSVNTGGPSHLVDGKIRILPHD